MGITQIGLNTNLTNLTSINISSIPTTASDILTQMPTDANTNTGFWLGMIVLLGVWIIAYLAFSDKTPFSEFKYNDIRAVNLAFGICSLMGISGAQTGFYLNLQHIMFFVTMFMLTWILVLAVDNKE